MKELQQRAHDIAVSILPHVLREDKDFKYYLRTNNGNNRAFNSFDVVSEYEDLYYAILERLQEFGDL